MPRSPSPIAALMIAGVCWGSSYAVVGLVDGSNPMLVTGSRFAIFGVLSWVLLGRLGGPTGVHWPTAFLHAVGGAVGLYLAEVTAIGLAGAGPTIAVVGSLPLVYGVVGARRDGGSLVPLLPSFVVTALAHVVIHSSSWHSGDRAAPSVAAGLLIATLGVAGFCVYALHSTDHLRDRPTLSPIRWASAVGVACGFLSMPLLIAGALGGDLGDPGRLGLAALFLAIIPSWLATSLWNGAVVAVPRSLAGQLLVFEPLSAFVFVHMVEGSVPGSTMVIGELLLLAGALLAVRTVSGRVPAVAAEPVRARA